MHASEVSFRPEGLARRLLASAIDFSLVAVYILVLGGIGTGTMHITSEFAVLNSPWTMDLFAFLVLILPVISYFALQEGSQWKATPGKRRVGIMVVNAQGQKLSWRQALIRSAIKFFPWQLAHTCVIQIWFGQTSTWLSVGALLAQGLVVIYILSILVSKEHRAPYDWLSGAYVVSAE
ncbi:MAG TPA: RDD family protein [Pyrinomonadaceae bacterium]|nr:RDD family protein [Pyrinomonadaceae bacterium]